MMGAAFHYMWDVLIWISAAIFSVNKPQFSQPEEIEILPVVFSGIAII
jgi:hypothetical protein